MIAHPHPRYGGTLDNPVVFHADRELNRAGLATLRLNFRGVRGSEGAYDDGRGEVDDVDAGVRWMRGVWPDAPLLIVGYSFGSRCGILHALGDPRVAGVVAIGLPVRAFDLSFVAELTVPLAVVQGSRDEFGSPAEVRELLEKMETPGEITVIDGAEHLFPGRAPEAGAAVAKAVEGMLEETR